MQEEVTQRTVALCVEATKLSAGMLQQAMKKVLDEMQKGVTGHKTKLHHGKQTLRQLMALAMWEAETSSLLLKLPLICCPFSACIRRNGSHAATLLWAVCPAELWSVFSLNAGTYRKCSSVWTAIPQETKPVNGCWRLFPTKSLLSVLSRQERTGTMF